MRRVIYPLATDALGRPIRPDSNEFFSESDTGTEPGYLIEDYSGSDDAIESYVPDNEVGDVVIVIDSIVFSGAGYDETQSDGRVDVLVDTTVNIGFNLSPSVIPSGTKLTIPIRNIDTRERKIVKAIVSNNSVSQSFKISSSGIWKVSAEEINNIGRQGVAFSMNDVVILAQDV